MSAVETPELSVIAPSYRDRDKLRGLLASLRAQTLDPARFEVIVVDDGDEPPLTLAPVELEAGVKLIRQRHAGPAAARNMALRHARGRVLVLVNADGVLADDALERHLAHHGEGAPARAIVGRFDWLPERDTRLVRALAEAGILFPYQRLEPHADIPFWGSWTGNYSVPAASLRAIGGFDESFTRALWEDVELGYRLERSGVPIHYDPDIGCGHDHAFTVRGWVRHAEWFGHEWVRFARKHGGATFSILGGVDEPTEAFAQQCLAGLLHQNDPHESRIAALERALDRGTDEEVAELVVAVNTVARMKGVAGAIWGFDPEALAARAAELARPTVVHTVAGAWDFETIPRLLDVLGDTAQLLVASYIYVPPGAVPDDPRVEILRVPPELPVEQMWRPVLDKVEAEALIFLEGTPLPTASEIRALARFLGISPWVGAIGLAARQGLQHTSAKLVPQVPRHVVATTRRVLALDPGGPGSFLDRLPQRALHQVALTPGGS